MKVSSIALLAIAIVAPPGSPSWAQVNQQKHSTSSEVEVTACLDRKEGRFELTNAFWYVLYNLTGQTAGLENNIGDELKVRGMETSAGNPSEPSTPWDRVPPTLEVTSVEVKTHKHPQGVPPVLGSLVTWVSYDNPEYGVGLRYPPTFGNAQAIYAHVQSNFAGEAATTDDSIVNVSIPRTTYLDSNYVDGNFTVFVNPKIKSEGTCKQFRTFWPEHTGSTTVSGVSYSWTLTGGVTMGTDSSTYQFHTFRNGLCYEFDFDFAASNAGGMDVPCAMQWVSEDDFFELIRSVLSTVSFPVPQFEPAIAEASNQRLAPAVISFEHGPTLQQAATDSTTVGISWKTTHADYVQIRYRCSEKLFASTVQSKGYGLGKCGEQTDTNLPPNGSMALLLSNFNSEPVDLVLTLEPFRDGVEYPNESRTISIFASVHAPISHAKSEPLKAPVSALTAPTIGCLRNIEDKNTSDKNKYWLISYNGWQRVVRSDTVDLSPYVNHLVKVSARREDQAPDWIVTSLTTVSDTCE